MRWDQDAQAAQAWLEPARAADVMHARALCSEFGVQLILLDAEASPDPGCPVLWVDSRADWAQLEQVDARSRLWRADAGVRLSLLHQKGVGIFAGSSGLDQADRTLAQWFASPFMGNLMHSGIVQAEVMLADGTLELLGPFGAKARSPLRSLSVQKKIPKIFELAQSPEAVMCAQCETWPLRYRLDALMSQSGDSLNLSWLFQGHGGSLAWLQTLWLSDPVVCSEADIALDFSAPDPGAVAQAAPLIEHAIKQTLDPARLFGKTPAAKGLESPQFT